MNRRNRIALGVSSTLVLGAAGAGIATAAKTGTTPPAGGGGPPGAAAIATYLGLTSDKLRSDLESGETLAQIAAAQGKTVSGLEAAIVADATTNLDAAVAAGKLTAAQEATMLADLKAHVDDMVNSTGPPAGMKGGPGGAGGGPASQAVADVPRPHRLGAPGRPEGRTDARPGRDGAGQDRGGLEAAILADAKTHLDAAVTAGKLTSAQESTMLADLSSHVADIVNSTGAARGRPRRRPRRATERLALTGHTGRGEVRRPSRSRHVPIGTHLPPAALWATFGVGGCEWSSRRPVLTPARAAKSRGAPEAMCASLRAM